MRIHLPSPGRCGVVLVASLLAAGCADDPAAPSRGAAGPRPATSVASRPQLIPNTVLYRDTGHHPASARSGSEQLMLRALLDIKGVTVIEVTTGTFDGPPPAGSISKLQVKAFAPNDSLLFTRNETRLSGGGFASVRTRGLAPGFRVQAQANIGGIDPARTDVVTVTDTVLPRPDLIVQHLQLPFGAPVGIPVPIEAIVREGKWALGARATCRLYVDGAAADSAPRIWVDAGGLVSCAFVHAFPTAGTYRVEVRAENVTPGDYDESNNARSATLDVGPNAFAYRVDEYTLVTITRNHYSGFWARLDAPEGSSYDYQYGDTTVYEATQLSATLPRTISFPISRVRVAQRVGTTIMQDTTLLALAPDYTVTDPDSAYSCVNRGVNGWWFWACSGVRAGTPSTWLAYGRWGGQVIYYSAGFSSWWSWGEGGFYSWNSWWADPPSGLLAPLGGVYEYLVALTDGGTLWLTNPKVIPQPFYSFSSPPPTCDQGIVDWATPPYVYANCSEFSLQQNGHWAMVQGVPEPVLPPLP